MRSKRSAPRGWLLVAVGLPAVVWAFGAALRWRSIEAIPVRPPVQFSRDAEPVLPCSGDGSSSPPDAEPEPPEPTEAFDEASSPQTRVVAEYRNGEEADRRTPLEALGGGVGAGDLDNDGLVDLVVPQGGGFAPGGAVTGRPTKVFRNNGDGTFADWSDRLTPLTGEFYTHGVALGDYDRDGSADVLLTGYGRVALFRNEADPAGGRRFRDVSEAAGLAPGGWAVSAAWADLDGDGFADLYVCHYANWSPTDDRKIDGSTLADRIYRNKGNGTFEDVSALSGVVASGKGVAVVACDFDGDGKTDVFVSNADSAPHLYLNRSRPGLVALEESGKACGLWGDTRGGRGVAVLDADGGGRPALLVATADGGGHRLFLPDGPPGRASFRDASGPFGLAAASRAGVGWGVAMLDWELSGAPEAVFAHGHGERFPSGDAQRAQRPAVFAVGGGTFARRHFRVGRFFEEAHQLRGVAVADFLGDGRAGLAASRLNGPLALLSARRPPIGAGRWVPLCLPLGLFGTMPAPPRISKPIRPPAEWLGVRLVGKGNRDVTGAVVRVTQGGQTQTRFAVAGGSFASSSDPRHLFALPRGGPVTVEVRWPRGAVQTWCEPPRGRYVTLREGELD